ncbi:MAG TPA: phosphotransferase [Candidatus Latescibacteria bacterium]|nr:phosphotransferase [Candidatus Latescibacterota bacterium]
MPERNDETTQVEAGAERVLGCPVRLTQTVASGRNSRVYRAESSRGEALAVKQFYRTRTDTRDFLQAEQMGLRFLWDHGEQRIPRPIAAAEDLLICEFIDGEQVTDVTEKDVDEAVDFLASLKSLSSHEGSADLPPASEACFTITAIIDNIDVRRQRLGQDGDVDALGGGLGTFLADEFDTTVRDTVDWSRSRLEGDRAGRFAEELAMERRTLSPSDFGFHNSLRRPDGSLVFVDFEHFGWDDPAKTVADVLLHPAMTLTPTQSDRFLAGMLQHFEVDRDLPSRLQAVVPLFGLKWCMILLNEFIPCDLARRRFAGGDEVDREALLRIQLDKARNMLYHVQATAGGRLLHRN